MFVCKNYIPKLGPRVQKLVGIKHELLEVSNVADAMLHRSHIDNCGRLGGNQDRLQESCECIGSMVVHLQMRTGVCSKNLSEIHVCGDIVICMVHVVVLCTKSSKL